MFKQFDDIVAVKWAHLRVERGNGNDSTMRPAGTVQDCTTGGTWPSY